jgi:hypothetical protein
MRDVRPSSETTIAGRRVCSAELDCGTVAPSPNLLPWDLARAPVRQLFVHSDVAIAELDEYAEPEDLQARIEQDSAIDCRELAHRCDPLRAVFACN